MLMATHETKDDFVSTFPKEMRDDRRCHILRVGPQGELRGYRWLAYSGYSAYCPVIRKSVPQNFNKRRWVSHPIFRGYLFVLLAHTGELSARIDQAPVDLRWLRQPGGDRPVTLPLAALMAIRDKEAEMLARSYRGKRPSDLEVKAGDDVLVDIDDYSTYRAQVSNIEKLDDKGRLSVLINMFGRLTPMEVSANQVRLA